METDAKTKHHGILLILTVVLLVVSLAIVGYFYFFYAPDSSLPSAELVTAQRRTLRVAGSDAAATVFKSLAEAYTKQNDKVAFEFLVSADEELGVYGVKEQLIDLGLTAQTSEPAEDLLVTFTPLARDALVFAVNDQVTLNRISGVEIADIYTGKISNWRELGGKNLQIVPVGRSEADSGTKLLRKTYLHENKMTERVKEVHSETDMLKILEEIPGSIGYLSNALVRGGQVKKLTVDGQEVGEDYELMRTLYLVTWKESSKVINDLIFFILNADNSELLKQLGFFSLN